MPERDLLDAIATELGVEPSFVEKDWHATQMIAAVAEAEYVGLQPVFSGGTSLSKGYGLIQRFSEDLDFKLLLPGDDIDRQTRRGYRSAVIGAIRAHDAWTIDDGDVLTGNQSRFFRCEVEYSPDFLPHAPMRERIRIEVTLAPPALPPEERSLRSLVARAQQHPPEVEKMACVTPAETAADKLSALTWRLLSHGRDEGGEDENMVRHLHDLAALEERAAGHPDFPELLKTLIGVDAARTRAGAEVAEMRPAERVSAVLTVLTADAEFRDRYHRFVAAMCYGSEDETPTFDAAIEAVRRLGRLLN